jgi:hypothetical protein
MMNIGPIDEALEAYVDARMEKGKETAKERFLSLVYMKHGRDEIIDFLLKVGGLARCYIYCLKLSENPMRGKDLAWMIAILAIAFYGLIMIVEEGSRTGGIVLLAGALVNGLYLVNMLTQKWKSIGLRISFYTEIIQIVEKELCS